jgi:hypothetical protein
VACSRASRPKAADIERLSAAAIDKLAGAEPEQPVKKSRTDFTNDSEKERKQRTG